MPTFRFPSTDCHTGVYYVPDSRRSIGEKLAGRVGQSGRILKLTAAVCAVALCTLILSPLILGLLGRLPPSRLVRAKQHRAKLYGNRTISAVALLAVAATMRIQATQTELAREQAARVIQLELLKLAMEDKTFRETYGPDYRVDDDDTLTRQRMYQALRIRYLEFKFLGGSMSEVSLRHQANARFFSAECNRAYWAHVKDFWAIEASSTQEARFVSIMNQAWDETAGG